MSARGGFFSRWGFSSRTPLATTQVQPAVVPLSYESELVPRFAEELAMGEQNPTSWQYTWKITNFGSLTQETYYSEVFTIGDNAWRILIFPKGVDRDCLSIYLDAADCTRLPAGWSRSTRFRLILVDQYDYDHSRIMETEHNFTARNSDWGFASFISLSNVYDGFHNGYLVNNTLTVVAEILAPQPPAENTELAEPPAKNPEATPIDTFDAYFANLEKVINTARSSSRGESNARNQKSALLTSEAPTLEEVEKVKLSLKECLSDIFKLNVKDRLAEAMSTLSTAKSGLSPDQQLSVKAFWANFNQFTSDFLIFEQDNAEFELQKLLKDQTFATMKKNHETHISYKQLLGDLTQEEEELNKKLEEVKSRREKLMSDWEILMVESEEAKSGHKDGERKVAEAEEKKRIAEERMSRSTPAWSNLKTQFC